MSRLPGLLVALCTCALLSGCPLDKLYSSSSPVTDTAGSGGTGSGTPDGGDLGGDGGSGTGSGSDSGSAGGSGGDSGGTDSAGAPGSGGTGDTVGTPGSGGTGADPGSGGTGAVASVGTVDGFGSVIVNGVRYDDTSATLSLEDSSALGLGMVVRITGSVNGNGTTGVAQTIESGAELIGQVSSVDTASAQFTVLGVTVRTSSLTVWANLPGMSGLSAGANVKLSGLWLDGQMQATRIEQIGAVSQYQLTAAIESLNTVAKTFRAGALTVSYALANLQGMSESDLVNGLLVRVRGASPPVAGVFAADRIKGWLSGPKTNGGNIHWRGTVYGFNSLADFQVLGTPIDASGNGVQFSADSSNIGNGSDIQIRGRWSNGVLIAQRVTILSGPGGTPPVYTLNGTVGNFSSLASFRVKGSLVDASDPSVVFAGGTSADMSNGKKVEVSGSQIVNDVLKASTVTFTVAP